MIRSITVLAALFCLVIALSVPAQSQGTKAFSIGAEFSYPTGDWGDVASLGFGGSASFQYGWKPNFDLLFNSGYLLWNGKDEAPGYDYSWSAIPLQFGGKYYFGASSSRPYCGAWAGFYFFNYKSEDQNLGVNISDSDAKFSFAPFLGYEYKFNPKVAFDLNARYQYVTDDLTNFGFRTGFVFGL